MTRRSRFRIAPITRRATPELAALARHTFIDTFGHLYPREDLEHYVRDALQPSRYAESLGDPRVAGWFALDADEGAVGYVIAGPCKLPVRRLSPNAGEIRQLYVRADFRNAGLGTRLLEHSLAWLDTPRRVPLYVGVWSRNLGAQRLYGRYGFRRVGEYEFPVGRVRDREFILKRVS